MKLAEVVADGFGRVQEVVHDAVEGLSAERLTESPAPGANTIAWLVWHLTRVQDDHVADLMGTEQIWTAQDWVGRFSLPFPASDTGYGHRPEDVEAVRPDSADLLTGYYDAVHEATTAWAAGLAEADLDRIVDEGWDPPVTLGVRLVSVLSDDLQHAGQAAYVRGLVLRDT
ncbi:DinB family protein [Amycolatopsis roodepoortensis]|uniref:mycothiol transferase n=1 Tax=Amycolatopsis roodepoortensis TaxID=700274 RepID=UPI00214D08F6|nr:DinB family protein [Amycolatopsis roodepoortensis]UUV30678.1 DinB family protein [Amycolatopsis roodepoortensis]